MSSQTQTGVTRTAAIGLLAGIVLFLAACSAETTNLRGDATVRGSDAVGQATAQPTEVPTTATDGDEPAPSSIAIATAAPNNDDERDDDPTSDPETSEDDEPQLIASGGAVDERLGITLSVGESQAGTGDVRSFMSGGGADDGAGSWLLTSVNVETSATTTWDVRSANFSLQNHVTGEALQASELFDAAKNRGRTIAFPGRHRSDMKVAFATPELLTGLDDWQLVVSLGDAIASVLPLEGPAFYEQYPLVLNDGIAAEIQLDPFVACENGATFSSIIESAVVAIEGQRTSDTVVFMPPGERLLLIDVGLTGQANNTIVEDSGNCGLVSAWGDFVLLVDGRPSQPFYVSIPELAGFSTSTLPLRFQIPADATSLELVVGDDQTPLAQWDVELPAATGEPGATRIANGGETLTPAPQEAPGDRPTELVTNQISSGGATGTMLFVDYAVGAATATTSGQQPFIAGEPAFSSEDRTYLVVELDIENTSTGQWSVGAQNIVLEDPVGRPFGDATLYDRTGDRKYSLSFNGVDSAQVQAVFETDGLVDDPAGWNIAIHNGSDIPLRLPLVGEAPASSFPIALSTGEPVELGTDPFPPSCNSGGLATFDITNAEVAIEGPQNLDRWGRVDPAHRLIVVDLDITNLVDEAFCGWIGLWPNLLLDVDGRLTRAFLVNEPNLDHLETGQMTLSFEIPAETQSVTLVGGSGRQAIASWDLKNPGEVLQNLGAQQRDNKTLITLDETLLFAFGESTIQQSALPALQRVASVLGSESSGEIEIVGHTDSIGDDASNQQLSEDRAEAVAAALEDAGINADRFRVTGQGESSPVAPNTRDDGTDNPGGRQQNRRVEVFFTTDG